MEMLSSRRYKFAKLIIPTRMLNERSYKKLLTTTKTKMTNFPLRYTDDRDVRVHYPVSGDGNHILNE